MTPWDWISLLPAKEQPHRRRTRRIQRLEQELRRPRTLIASPFLREPLSPEERALRQQLAELAADLQHPRALNALIAALLYYPMDQVSLPTDPDLLPPWLAESLTRLGAQASTQGSAFA